MPGGTVLGPGGKALLSKSLWKWKSVAKLCPTLLLIPWTAAHQAPLPMGFLRQEYWSGLPIIKWMLLLLFSHEVVSSSLWPHKLQHTRHPCSSLLLEFVQTHVHWVGDAIQPSHPLSSPSPPALNLSQHQGLFQWVGSLHQVAKLLELQHQSFQWIFRTDFLWDLMVWSPCSSRDSQEPSPTPQFKSINSSALSFLYSPTLTSIPDCWKNHIFD